jgi:MFS family permease
MFKRFVIISCIWQFGVSMASPFFNVYIVDTLGAAYHWISILTLVSGVSAILVQRGVGNMADKFGQRSILIIGALGASLIPLMYVFTTAPEHVIPINIISGISWAAVDLAAFNYLLETTRGKERAMYSAIYWSMTDIPIIFGPIVGGAIVDALPMGIFSFSGYTFMFFVSWLVRLSGALLFMKFLLELPERKVYSTRYVTGELMIVGFSGMWRSFHLIKETGSIPSRIVNGVEMFVRRSIRAVS